MRRTCLTPARRLGAAAVATAVGASALAITPPASAEPGDVVWKIHPDSSTLTVAASVTIGGDIHIEGSGWTDGIDNDGPDTTTTGSERAAHDGSYIAIKLGGLDSPESGLLATHAAPGTVDWADPTTGLFLYPDGGTSGVSAQWYGVIADDNGDFSVDVPWPTVATTTSEFSTEWEAGPHYLQLLTGAIKPGGDTVRSARVEFEAVETATSTINLNASNGGRGAPAAQATITATAPDGTFAPSTALTATVDGAAKTFTAGGTSNAAGGLGTSTLVFPPGELRAGAHTVALSDGTTTISGTVSTLPVATFPSLAQGGEGTVTLANLPDGASVSSVDFGDATFSGLPAEADASGTASFGVEIPTDAALGTFPVKITLSDGTTYTLPGQKISPSAEPFGADAFTINSSTDTLFQGLYQSAYSAASDALYVSAGSGTNAAEDGAVYKLDPQTLAIEESLTDLPVNSSGGKLAAYGIGVDDEHGTVWVTSTRKNTLYVLDQDDLSVLKVFREGTISHSRDVVYDPTSDRIFVTSASEGTSGEGYIAVFEADDADGDGEKYEEITKIQTGPRTDYSPMSLELGKPGTLYSPSLSSAKVAVVDTVDLTATFLTIDGIDVGGRGASGIAYDEADNELFIASQNSDELVIADATTGATRKEVPTGAGALNVAFDKVNGLAYVANFGGTTISVVDGDGTIVANLPVARANHVHEDGLGNVFAVDKASPNKVWRITPHVLRAATPTISGTVKVGSTLTADPGTWPDDPDLAYQWLRDGAPIAGATRATYVLTAADLGTHVSVSVRASKSGFLSASRTSEPTPAVATGSAVAGSATVSGTPKVNRVLTVTPRGWPAGTTYTYQWKRGGAVVGTSNRYQVRVADSGKNLTVTVTGNRAGYASATWTGSVRIATLTPAERKVANAQATVAKDRARITAIRARITAVKQSGLSQQKKAAQVRRLNKQLAQAQKKLTKDKKALAKARKKLRKSARK